MIERGERTPSADTSSDALPGVRWRAARGSVHRALVPRDRCRRRCASAAAWGPQEYSSQAGLSRSLRENPLLLSHKGRQLRREDDARLVHETGIAGGDTLIVLNSPNAFLKWADQRQERERKTWGPGGHPVAGQGAHGCVGVAVRVVGAFGVTFWRWIVAVECGGGLSWWWSSSWKWRGGGSGVVVGPAAPWCW
jgi:hypothetical protein